MPMHEHYEELCALAAIGQLSPEEHQELVAHLQACDLCKRAGDDFAVILDQLPSATPPDDSGDTEELLSESYRQKFLLKAAAAGVRFTPEVTDSARRDLQSGNFRSRTSICGLGNVDWGVAAWHSSYGD